jgi:hypothetical protein
VTFAFPDHPGIVGAGAGSRSTAKADKNNGRFRGLLPRLKGCLPRMDEPERGATGPSPAQEGGGPPRQSPDVNGPRARWDGL